MAHKTSMHDYQPQSASLYSVSVKSIDGNIYLNTIFENPNT